MTVPLLCHLQTQVDIEVMVAVVDIEVMVAVVDIEVMVAVVVHVEMVVVVVERGVQEETNLFKY